LALVASACVVDVQGAPCVVHTDCPSDQACIAEGAEGRCRLGARQGDGPFADGGTGGGGATGGGGGTTGGGGGTTGGGGGTTGGGGGMTGGGGGMTGGGGGMTGGGGGMTGGGGGMTGGGGGMTGGGGGMTGGGGGMTGGGGGGDAGIDAGTDAGIDAGLPDAGPPDRCDGGCFGNGVCACGVYTVHNSTLRSDDVFWIEGRFDRNGGATVVFPGPDGGISLTGTFEGPTRLRVSPPSAGTAGPLSVSTNSVTVPGPSMRLTSFSLGLGRFDSEFDQAAYAIPMPQLATGGRDRVVATLGNRVFEFSDRVQVARLNADGTIGPFSGTSAAVSPERLQHSVTRVGERLYVIGGFPTMGTGTNMVSAAVDVCEMGPGPALNCSSSALGLNTARAGHTAAVVGEWLYVIGGVDGTNTPLASIERALIRADGSLGPFTTVPVSLQTARSHHATVVTGRVLYVIGGLVTGTVAGPTNSIETSIIVDGELTGFVPSIRSLNVARAETASVVIDRELWVISGSDGMGFRGDTEVAPLDVDGLLTGPFSVSAQGTPVSPRAGASAFVHGNFLFLAGGTGGKGKLTSIERASLNRSGDVETPSPRILTSGGWNFTNARVVVIGDKLWALLGGGQQAERFTVRPDGSLVADGTELNVMITPERGFAPLMNGDRLFVVGGETVSFGVRNTVEIFPWSVAGFFNRTNGTPLTTAHSRMSMVVMGSSVYALAGATGSSSAVATWEAGTVPQPGFELALGTSMSAAPLLVARTNQSAFVTRSLYLVGGSSTLVERVEVDGQVGLRSVDAGTPLATPHAGGVSLVVGDAVYVIGGDGVSAVERAQLMRISAAQDGVLGTFSSAGAWAPVPTSCGIVIGNFLHLFSGNQVLSYRLL
jgi:hypothetical protein